jgi:hypothetical protein
MGAFKGLRATLAKRTVEQTIWASVGILVALVLATGVLADTSGATSSTSAAPTIPAERLTPLGCDTAGYAECTDRFILWKMCGIDILGDHMSEYWVSNPLVSGGWVPQYSYRGDPAMEIDGDPNQEIYRCLRTGRSLTLTHDEVWRLIVAGTKADVAPALMQMLAESKN